MGKLATTTAAPPAVENVITRSQATQIVKKIAADQLRAAKAAQKAKLKEFESVVGGQTQRVDESVVSQAKALMTRIALIARKRDGQYTSNTALEGIVKKLGGVIGELEAFMLTNKAVGLFEDIDEHEYVGYSHRGWGGAGEKENPLSAVGRKAREAAEEALAGYIIVDDPPKSKGAKNVTPDPATGVTVKDLAADRPFEDDDANDEFEAKGAEGDDA